MIGTLKLYWADERDQKRLIARCLERYAWHMSVMHASGRLEAMQRMVSTYYGNGTDGQRSTQRISDAGEQGEVSDFHVNSIRPVLSNTLAIIAGTRPAVKPVATNGDSATAAQTRLAMGLHEFYDRKISAKSLEIDCARGALIASSWWLIQGWKASAGEEVSYDVEKDQIYYEGDVELFTSPPWRTAADLTATNEADRRWVLFRKKYPRWDLIARAKDETTKQKLTDAAGASKSDSYLSKLMSSSMLGMTHKLDVLMGEDAFLEDEVWVWELRHLPCPSLPMGRLVRFVEPDIILWDSYSAGEPAPQEGNEDATPKQTAVKYPYEELHAYEMAPERVIGTTHGHTSMFDLMGLQDFIDTCTTSIATTVNLMGMPHLWSPDGNAPNVHQLSTGPTILECHIRPELIDFNAVKQEIIEAAKWATGLMNASAALNDTVMGNPQKGMAASAQALQRAQAVQYHQISQDEWVRLIERNANGRLRLLKRFARTERVAEIAGAGDSWELKKWKAADIAGVERFQVEPTNPMSATFEGRQSMAEQMGVQGDDLFDFLTTGSLKKVTQHRVMQLELIERNVALLQQGKGMAPLDQQQTQLTGRPVFMPPQPGPDGKPMEVVSILRSDAHHMAIPKYLAVVNSPESRSDIALMQPALDAVTESLRLWLTLSPDDCQAFGIPALPSIMAPPMPAAPPAPPPANDNQEPGVSTPKGQPGIAGQPKPPKNPITGAEDDAPLALGA